MTVWDRPAAEAGLVLDEVARPGWVAARPARVHESHVAGLNALVDRIRAETRERVPWLDPPRVRSVPEC